MAKAASVCAPESMDSEDMLFMLYTSGSTGKPKGIVHSQAGYLLYAALTHKVSQLHPLGKVDLLTSICLLTVLTVGVGLLRLAVVCVCCPAGLLGLNKLKNG